DEIQKAEQLLKDMAKQEKDYPYDPNLRDAFGRGRNLQLGIPSGENSHRLYDVHPKLAKSVIKAHIAEKQSELVQANERARIGTFDSQGGQVITLGQIAYDAYCKARKYVSVSGERLPHFAEQSPELKAAWEAAAKAVARQISVN